MRSRRKKWALPFINENKDIFIDESFSSPSFFFSPIYLEIGTGKGDFLLGMASIKKGNYLGIEKDLSIAAIAGKKIKENKLANIKLINDDFDKVLPYLSKYRFDAIYLNFSDPWPKLKHHKRRLTYKDRLNSISSLLIDDGLIYIKTDNAGLFSFTLEQIPSTNLEIVSKDDDYKLEDNDVETEYEKQFRSLGIPIHRLILKKKGN